MISQLKIMIMLSIAEISSSKKFETSDETVGRSPDEYQVTCPEKTTFIHPSQQNCKLFDEMKEKCSSMSLKTKMCPQDKKF